MFAHQMDISVLIVSYPAYRKSSAETPLNVKSLAARYPDFLIVHLLFNWP